MDDNLTLSLHEVRGLAPGEAVEVRSVPWAVNRTGNHTIEALADLELRVLETNEFNNQRDESFVAVAVPKADLYLQVLTWSPAVPQVDDEVRFRAVVLNAGDALANASKVRFTLDGAQLGTLLPIPALEPDATAEVHSILWTATGGNHTIVAMADADHEVAERYEGNNARSLNVTVAGPPYADLRVADIVWSPPQPEPGDNVTFTARVENVGEAAAGNFTVRFRLDGAALGPDVLVLGLAANATTDVTSPNWTASGGVHNISALADPADEVPESDEHNNERFENVSVPETPLPDLVVSDLVWNPPDLEAGEAVTFYVRLTNVGWGAAGNSSVRFLVDGVALGADVPAGGLAPNATVGVPSEPWTAVGGVHNISFLADSGNEVSEASESNNEGFRSVAVNGTMPAPPGSPAPVPEVPAEPAPPEAPPEPAPPEPAPPEPAPESPEPGAPPASPDPATTPAAGAAPEAPAAKTPSSPIPGRPNLRVAVHRPAVLLPELLARFTADVTNDGDADAGPFVVRFALNGAALSDHVVAGLAGGATLRLDSAAWPPALGEHALLAQVDALDDVAERDEADNAASLTFWVPSVGVGELELPLSSVSEGDRLPRHAVAASPLLPEGPQAVATTGLSLAALLASLYHRFHADPLAAPGRRRVYEAVRADPGATVGTVARRIGLSYKTVLHHVRVLRRAGLLTVLDGPQARLFVVAHGPAAGLAAVAALRTPAARRLWERLQEGPAGPRRLARELGLAPSTIASHARRLEAAGLLVRLPGGALAARASAP